eukprot:3284842-Pyramimonas_sp.AAC.1
MSGCCSSALATPKYPWLHAVKSGDCPCEAGAVFTCTLGCLSSSTTTSSGQPLLLAIHSGLAPD